jgi:hypothetical protein
MKTSSLLLLLIALSIAPLPARSGVFSWRFADTGESGGADCKLSSFGFHLLSAHLCNPF